MSPFEGKNQLPVFPRDIINTLDDFHRHLALVLEKRGLIRIVDEQPTGG